MQNWQVAVVVLASVLVGAALPALIQVWVTLRTARGFLITGGERIERGLVELNGSARRIEAIVGTTGELAGSLRALSEKIRVASAVGAAVGPAVAAAVRAFRAPPRAESNGPPKPPAVQEP
jgi:hypothetical protein